MQQLESAFKRTINCNEYQSKLKEQTQNRYVDYLIDPSFQGVNRSFVLLLENTNDRNTHTGYFLSKVKIKDYNVVIDERNFCLKKNYKTLYDNIRKIASGREDNYTTWCLLDYIYFKENYELIDLQ